MKSSFSKMRSFSEKTQFKVTNNCYPFRNENPPKNTLGLLVYFSDLFAGYNYDANEPQR